MEEIELRPRVSTLAGDLIHLYHEDVAAVAESPRWLFLIHQLPKDPAYLRVKVGRRLTSVGALALKNSVYVLPKSEGTSEDFQWVRREILEGGGDATVLEAHLVDGLTDEQVEARFRDAKNVEYAEVKLAAEELATALGLRRKRRVREQERAAALSTLGRLERRVQELVATDFFEAKGRHDVATLLQQLRAQVDPPHAVPEVAAVPVAPNGCTWVTRVGIHVDRIASAWLIQRFIDRDARFKFVPAAGYCPLAGELRFDMLDAEYTHEGDRCTFEVLCLRFQLTNPGLTALGELIHDIDIKDGKFGRPETAGLAAQIAGLALLHREDDVRLLRGGELFDELRAYFAAQATD